MLFNTWTFAVFFIIVYTVYRLNQRSYKRQNLVLFAASYIFYGWWNVRFLFLLVISTFLDYTSSIIIDRERMTGAEKAKSYTYLLFAAFLLVLFQKIEISVHWPLIQEKDAVQWAFVGWWILPATAGFIFVRDWAALNVKKGLVNIRSNASEKKPNGDQAAASDRNKTLKRKLNYKNNLTIHLLKKIQNECLANDSRFMILDIPSRLSRTRFVSNFPLKEGADRLFNIVSPISKFRERRGEKLYWEKSHGHFTPLGCDLVGELLADYIHEHHLLECGAWGGPAPADGYHRLNSEQM